MKITCRIDGGFAVFPGLARPFTVDVDALPDVEARRMRDAVASCRFFDRDEPAASTAPDSRRDEITVYDDGRRRTLSVPESDDDADLRSLIVLLQERRADARRG